MLIRRAQIVTVLLLAAACLVAFVSVTTTEAHSADPLCSVGAPASVEEGPTLPEKPSGPELVIACGKSAVGPFEIFAYPGMNHSLCTVYQGSGLHGAECGEAIGESRLATDGFLLTGTNWAWGHGPGRSSTALNGWVRTDVARVEVRYHRRDEKPISHADATVAQVDGELLGSLDQTTPFGRFAVVLPGCTVPQGLRILAFDSAGKLIGSVRGRKSNFASPCRPGG